MSRLADYFVVIGYDHEKERSGTSHGKILQRFPEKDWEDSPFIQGLELFCQPAGWSLSTQRQQPTFFVSVLTDMDAERHYCACMTFNEPVAMTQAKPDDEDGDEQETTVIRHSVMYAPKCLALVSRLDYFEVFRNCLGLIYTVWIDNMSYQLETLIGNILGCVQVPPAGGPQVRFSIGAGDRQALQPPLSPTIPVSNTTVAMMFQQLGIHNTITLFVAALTDCKVLFHSQSYSRLANASHALHVIMYPLNYSYVYIPLLPAALLEVLNTPTPFIAGIHSSLRNDISDLLDVIIVDLDGGSISVPECITVPALPEPMLSRMLTALTMLLNPELLTADYAFTPQPCKPSQSSMLDKEIRAVFLRLFAELFTGYRSCLTLIRIHPEPYITFHKANFLGHRGMVEDDFLTRVLDSMSFHGLVRERGPPYRPCDIFDEVFAGLYEQIKDERSNLEKMLTHIRELASQLYVNENPNPQPYVQKIPKPTEGAYSRIHQPSFPALDWIHIQEIIDDGLAKWSKTNLQDELGWTQVRPQQPRIVPMGPHISIVASRGHGVNNSARRLEVLRNCVSFIFENKISDARKIFPAVLRALKSKVARLALTQELSFHVQSNRASLEHQQFDLVVRLLNAALQNDSSMDENGVAYAILPLATAFCRKLCTGVMQFAYTCIQEHAVWTNLQFWEAAFYQDVQKDIRKLYLPQYEAYPEREPLTSNSSASLTEIGTSWAGESYLREGTPDMLKRRSIASSSTPGYSRAKEIGALEIAAEQLRKWPTLSKEEQTELISNEESTVYSQAIHYSNRMVYMRVPLDSRKTVLPFGLVDESASNSNVTSRYRDGRYRQGQSIAESESYDAESGFDEPQMSVVGASVTRFISRFVDKVCSQSNVSPEHIKALHQMIPGCVAMHMEYLEGVNRESKRLPPIQKPKILTPVLLPGEEIVTEGLRVFLLPDGREEGTGGNMGGPCLLPAEGAIFLTQYRIIFKGTPCDPLACEQVVVRCFPISTITKEKKVNVQYLSHIDQWLQDIVQIRSNTFQLMKVAFDEEVGTENVEVFRKLIHRLRNPQTVLQTFAFTGVQIVAAVPDHKSKEKQGTLRGFAKKTLVRTARKAGLMPAKQQRKHKYVLPTRTPEMYRKSVSSDRLSVDSFDSSRPPSSVYDEDTLSNDGFRQSPGPAQFSLEFDESETTSVIDEADTPVSFAADPKSLERLSEKVSYRDYQRLGLGTLNSSRSRTEPFRITIVNASYSVCRSYPALLCVPQSVNDDSIRKFARTHRQYRFPVVSWRHPRNKAVLLRASGFHSRGVMGIWKSHHNAPSSTTGGEIMSTSIEQEKYFHAIVSCTPLGSKLSATVRGSMSSLDSLMLPVGDRDPLSLPPSPNTARRNPLSRAVNTLRSSGGKAKYGATGLHPQVPVVRRSFKGNKMVDRLSNRVRSSKGNISLGRFSTHIRDSKRSIGDPSKIRSSTLLETSENGHDQPSNGLSKAALYILGEKAQIKNIKLDSFPNCEFIPVDFSEVRHVKASFKKLLRACVPSAIATDEDQTFYKLIEDSGWLTQLQGILQLAGVAVDLMDLQGSSVMVCLEDGWDITTQVVSMAQLMLDPYYRTLQGFRVLVEREWLSCGHRFTHRSNQTSANQASGFAPIFLQFLDAVHQLHHQFPLSFEFNQFYIKFLAYHYVSNRFRTFMLDHECERLEAGFLLDDRPKTKMEEEEAGYASRQANTGTEVWEFIDKYHKKTTLFYNFSYVPPEGDSVLRPYSSESNLRIWDYFRSEDLAHGPSYDMDIVHAEVKQNEEQEMIEGNMSPSMRRIANLCYDNLQIILPDVYTWLFREIYKLEKELDHLPMQWRPLWDQMESPHHELLQRQMSLNTQMIRMYGRDMHKRSTIDILVRGKMAGEASKMFSQAHRFERCNFTTPAYCDLCSRVLWGLSKTGMKCAECGYNSHEKCLGQVPKNCARLRSSMSDSNGGSSSLSLATKSGTQTTSTQETPSVTTTDTLVTNTTMYDQFTSNHSEHRTHEGYLFKRGALLKGWKQRWFVLDSVKHQLRYYDTAEDSHCKGLVDLAEVVSVAPLKNVQEAPKKTDKNAGFEMKTSKRFYHFLAPNGREAQEWIDKIQSCIQ